MVILETLTGVRTTQEAADVLGVALVRYYVLETRALEGLIAALEPRARGRVVSAERESELLRAQTEKLEREVRRYQSLHRTTQRAMGLPKAEAEKKPATKGSKKPARRRNKTSRGERILKVLRSESEGAGPEPAKQPRSG